MNAILKPVTENLEDLIAAWRGCKASERQYQQDRLAIEERICSLVELKQEGTNRVGDLTITTGLTRSWDQAKLAEVASRVTGEYFPFKVEYKEDRKFSKSVEERFPDLWREIQPALTLKPKKPSFKEV